jgi:hypothetical protein
MRRCCLERDNEFYLSSMATSLLLSNSHHLQAENVAMQGMQPCLTGQEKICATRCGTDHFHVARLKGFSSHRKSLEESTLRFRRGRNIGVAVGVPDRV